MRTNTSSLLLFIQLVFVCRCHYIQKCCDREQQLDEDFNTCIDFDGNNGIEKYKVDHVYNKDGMHLVKSGENDTHHIWWLPPDIKFVSSKSHSSGQKAVQIRFDEIKDMRFLFDTKYPCSINDREIVPFTDYVFILEDGSLLITNVDDNVRPRTMLFPYSSYCVDRVSFFNAKDRKRMPSHILDHSYAIILCPCLYMPCVRMCCKWKHYLNPSKDPKKCEYSPNVSLKWNLKYKDSSFEEIPNVPEKYAIIQNQPKCEHGEYHLNENSTDDKKFWILPDGKIQMEGHPYVVNFKDYCIHYWSNNGSFPVNLRICIDPEEETSSYFQRILYGTYFAIGTFFLGLTLLVYIVVKELRSTIHSYYLISHVFCMFVSSFTLTINEFYSYMFTRHMFCITIAYVMQFSFIAAMFWLNILCIDISVTFKVYASSQKCIFLQKGRKHFILNSIYVWGITAIITFITMTADNTTILDELYRPKLGRETCWFSGDTAKLIYFYLPVSVLLSYNFYLFLCTTKQIIKLQKEIGRIFDQDSRKHIGTNNFQRETHKLTLYAKLFGLMGVTWIFEILSWAIGGPPYYWYITDAINAMRGLFIFLICCCKKKILLKFLYSFLNIPKKIYSHTTQQFNSSSFRTDGTSITSRTISTIQLEMTDISNRSQGMK